MVRSTSPGRGTAARLGRTLTSRKEGSIARNKYYDKRHNRSGGQRVWRGPAKALGDDVIFEIFPSAAGTRSVFQSGSFPDVSPSQLEENSLYIQTQFRASQGRQDPAQAIDWSQLYHFLVRFYFDLQRYVETLVKTYVPIDTGALQQAMVGSFALGSRASNFASYRVETNATAQHAFLSGDLLMRMVINTGDLDYANPVNNMPTDMVKHPSPAHSSPRTGRSGLILHDPTAVTSWYGFILSLARKYATRQFNTLLSQYTIIRNGASFNDTRKLFGVKAA